MSEIKKVVLAYSGGLDTSVIIPWLKEHYDNCEVIAVCGNVGQDDELDDLKQRAVASGASKLYVEDLTDEFVNEFVIPTMQAGADYEGYLLGTSLARPILAKRVVEIAKAEGADAVCHGSTGKGNDQVRFELAIMHFAPEMKIITPWREWDIQSRNEEIDYAEAHHIPLKINRETNYSKDKNLWHLSHEGLDLEDPGNEPQYEKEGFLEMSVSPLKAPDTPTYAMPDDVVTMGFYNLETYDNYAYQTVNGITFGYLSYTEHTNGLPTPSGTDYGVVYLDDHETIAKQIADMRPNCDVLIVSAHMGTEGTHEVNDFQRETAQWLADQGVDVIIGTHPHVVQNAAWLTGANGNTTFIVYSLGNFINAQSSRDNVIGAILDVYFDKTTQPDGSVSIAIRDPKLHCVISQYEAGYKNIRVIPYSQYTDELGAAHGEFTLSREYIESMLRSTIDEEFLTLD